MTMKTRADIEADIAELERRRVDIIKQLIAKFRTPAIDATDRAAAAQAGISIEDARLQRIHLQTSRIDAQIRFLKAALDLL